jgi:hypothetical protein
LAEGGRQPVLSTNYAELGFGPAHFALELQKTKQKQMIRVQLLVKDPALVVERIKEMVKKGKEGVYAAAGKCYIAVKVTEAKSILISDGGEEDRREPGGEAEEGLKRAARELAKYPKRAAALGSSSSSTTTTTSKQGPSGGAAARDTPSKQNSQRRGAYRGY